MFWKRRTHRLPKFPPQAAATFRALCADLKDIELAELRGAVEQMMLELREDEKKNRVSTEEGIAVGACAMYLLDHIAEFPQGKQRLVIGAARYFAVEDDPFDDEIFASGFHDDKCIMNYVLEELGIEDRYFDVS